MDDSYWDLVFPTEIENWPRGLLECSIETAIVGLNQEQTTALRTTNLYSLEMGMEKPPKNAAKVLNDLKAVLSGVISARFPNGAFVRLGSRSPKDSWDGIHKGFRCRHGQRVLKLLTDSERIHDDLLLAKHHNHLPVLVLRKWIDIEDWQEFRVFIKDRRLVGISQYGYDDFYPQIPARLPEIEATIREEYETVINLLPANNMIADFVLFEKDGRLKATLLEINPFFIYTDPCLFDWDKDTFDTFNFRYVTESPKRPNINGLLQNKNG
jgi:hypothetical protein